MKKRFLVLLLLPVFLLAGCAKSGGDYVLLESSKNYKVYAWDDISYWEDGYYSDFVYLVFNNAGEKIDSGYGEFSEPYFCQFDNDILKLEISAGSNAGTTTYYQLETSLISEAFQNVCYDDGEICAYVTYAGTTAYICVQELFSSDFLLKEELDMGGIMATVFTASLDGDTLSVEHVRGENFQDVTETFQLNRN